MNGGEIEAWSARVCQVCVRVSSRTSRIMKLHTGWSFIQLISKELPVATKHTNAMLLSTCTMTATNRQTSGQRQSNVLVSE